MKTLVIIPARGGSKGVPRKNLRPLNNKPLIWYSINAACQANSPAHVVVTTDDEEISLFARRFGAEVIMRPPELGRDTITIDPVIEHAYQESRNRWNEEYDVIITVQPTSPLIRDIDIDKVAAIFNNRDIDTVISVTDDRHLRWIEKNEETVPEYKERVNRQQLPSTYKETGALIACRPGNLDNGTRIGKHIHLYKMDYEHSIDIDTHTDFYICESLLKRKRIVFVVTGNKQVGMGHAYRGILIAHELVGHEIIFVCSNEDQLAADHIENSNYQVYKTSTNSILDYIIGLNPDMVINDILDTKSDYIITLKKKGIVVVNFEDMGLGAEVADLVVNALYPHQIPGNNILVGSRYFCLRDEFLHTPERKHIGNTERVLITFGGVDEGNITCRVLEILNTLRSKNEFSVEIILGPAYPYKQKLEKLVAKSDGHHDISIIDGTIKISEHMAIADLAITSGGRTVYELAALGIPTVVICQNQRETTHTFASSENGIVNLGLHSTLDDGQLGDTLEKIISSFELRQSMREKVSKLDLTRGKIRVIEKIERMLQ